MPIQKPVNDWQRRYNELCNLGGGRHGGPARTRVQQLLHDAGQELNEELETYVLDTLETFCDFNPWHVCFAIGVAWGHLAKTEDAFIEPATLLMSDWNDVLLGDARIHFLERGPDPLEQSLRGGHMLFSRGPMPDHIPNDLAALGRVEQRWLDRVIGPQRPPYIGSWNAVAMFMAAVFAHRSLWTELRDETVLLPPGGPIHIALRVLHNDHVTSEPPAGNELDDQAFEPGALYQNQEIMNYLWRGHDEWSVMDVHSGLYRLGTNRP